MAETSISRIVELYREAAGAIDPDQLAVVDDDDSDTLMVHFSGRGVPATSVVVTDDVTMRFDRAHDRVVRVQLDHFLSRVVHDYPQFLDLLDIAELRDVSPADIAQARRTVAQQQRGAVIGRLFDDLGLIASAAD